jgi:hypothetical protein
MTQAAQSLSRTVDLVAEWIAKRQDLKVEIWFAIGERKSIDVGMWSATNPNRHIVPIPVGSNREEVVRRLDQAAAKLGSPKPSPPASTPLI